MFELSALDDIPEQHPKRFDHTFKAVLCSKADLGCSLKGLSWKGCRAYSIRSIVKFQWVTFLRSNRDGQRDVTIASRMLSACRCNPDSERIVEIRTGSEKRAQENGLVTLRRLFAPLDHAARIPGGSTVAQSF